jgi:hypothetical protein
MHKLKDTAQTPHCGWIYTVPETKTSLEGSCYLELIDKVMENYSINGIEKSRQDVHLEVQDYLCRKIPDGLCEKFRNFFVTTIHEIINSTSQITSSLRVEPEQAEERAAICLNCEMNAPVNGDITGNGIPGLIKRGKAGRSTSVDKDLHLCAVCKCFIEVMVHIKPEALGRIVRHTHRYPEHCWKRREIEHLRRQP